MNRQTSRVIAVAMVLSAALAGPSLAAPPTGPTTTPTRPTGPTGPRLMAPDLSCTVWFAKDDKGSKLTDPIYPITQLPTNAVWLFFKVHNGGKGPAKAFDVAAKISNATYTVFLEENPKNLTWIKNFTTGLKGVKETGNYTSLAVNADTPQWKVGKLVFLPQQEVQGFWLPGTGAAAKPHQIFIKMAAEGHVTYSGSSKACSAPQVSIRYDDVP